jgi:aminoglycoside phosphotransferase (APT) family kinase protein
VSDPAQRLRRAVATAGLDPDQPFTPVATFSNEVWLGDAIAVRINHGELVGGDPARMLREAAIAARLPPEARYPPILAAGADPDLDAAWLITRRVPGTQLGRAWQTMSPRDRERAIRQLAEALDALHATPTDGLSDDIEGPHTLPLDALLALVDRAIDQGEDPALLHELAAFVRERWRVFEGAPLVLAHGDPHLENVLWDGVNVTALLDLEWSRAAFRECDLEILLSIADHPALFAAQDYEHTVRAADYTDIPRWLAVAMPAWFSHPDLLDRLDLLHVSRTLGALVDAPGFPIRIAHLRAVLAGHSPFGEQLSAIVC